MLIIEKQFKFIFISLPPPPPPLSLSPFLSLSPSPPLSPSLLLFPSLSVSFHLPSLTALWMNNEPIILFPSHGSIYISPQTHEHLHPSSPSFSIQQRFTTMIHHRIKKSTTLMTPSPPPPTLLLSPNMLEVENRSWVRAVVYSCYRPKWDAYKE